MGAEDSEGGTGPPSTKSRTQGADTQAQVEYTAVVATSAINPPTNIPGPSTSAANGRRLSLRLSPAKWYTRPNWCLDFLTFLS